MPGAGPGNASTGSGRRVRILATDPVPSSGQALFAHIGRIEVAGNGGLELCDAEVLLVRGTRVDASTMQRAPRLRIIARTGAGYDGVDVEAATERGIAVLYAPEAGTVPVAEGAFALILAAAKRLGEMSAVVRSGTWRARYEVEAADLRGAVLGIVGLGRIGQEVARLGHAFGMQVVAHDPLATPGGPRGIARVSLEELMAHADVVSLHCALTDVTRAMITRERLARAKPGAILVNVARGAVVESEAVLLEALEAGWLSAVGLDVYADEPPDPGHPLLAHPRVVCTPHAVGLSVRWNESVFQTLVEGIEQLLAGTQPRNLLNPQVQRRAVVAPTSARRV